MKTGVTIVLLRKRRKPFILNPFRIKDPMGLSQQFAQMSRQAVCADYKIRIQDQ